jgi:aryl-alcohol dehydrogenase-like predicted oxidoreductase
MGERKIVRMRNPLPWREALPPITIAAMDLRTLGSTGITVSRLGLGGLFVAGFASGVDEARAAIRHALDLGVTYIDTAPTYAASEEVLGRVLAAETRPLVLSTKLGGKPEPFAPQDPDCLRRAIEGSLERLGRDRIDLLMVHEPDRPRQYAWWSDFARVEGPVLETLASLKRQGVIRATGIAGTTTTELAHLCRSGRFDVVLTAFNSSILWREAELEVYPAAKAAGMGIIVGSPLQQGALARRFDRTIADPSVWWLSAARREQLRRLYALVDACGIDLPELALRFPLSDPRVDCVLMGARSVEEVGRSVAAAERGPLPAEILRQLAEIAALVPVRPCGEPMALSWFMDEPQRWPGQGVL